ncbi:hypothetical protein [Persicobacter psychrovividus]|uniref:Membrane or secreted protein n=1 Tax=Persicobacter psychrovividus TaxID=387638 RepID=A0ABM7VAG9_9BACT|nr:hypothetical protein PEPS_02010 [Persicobacter psychrovividus]
MATYLIVIGFFAAFFVLMSVRLIFKKDGQFRGTCASQSPFLNKTGEPCGFCGKTPDQCKNRKDKGASPSVDELLAGK